MIISRLKHSRPGSFHLLNLKMEELNVRIRKLRKSSCCLPLLLPYFEFSFLSFLEVTVDVTIATAAAAEANFAMASSAFLSVTTLGHIERDSPSASDLLAMTSCMHTPFSNSFVETTVFETMFAASSLSSSQFREWNTYADSRKGRYHSEH